MYYLGKEKKQPIQRTAIIEFTDSFDKGEREFVEFGINKVYIYMMDGKKVIRNAVQADGNDDNIACRVEERRIYEMAIKEGEIKEVKA
jgi:hypothetical protein